MTKEEELEQAVEAIAAQLTDEERLAYMDAFFQKNPYVRCDYKVYLHKQIKWDYEEQLQHVTKGLRDGA